MHHFVFDREILSIKELQFIALKELDAINLSLQFERYPVEGVLQGAF